MSEKDITEYQSEKFLRNRDNRVSKPDIWICEQNIDKSIVWPTNWSLNTSSVNVVLDKPNDISLYSKMANNSLAEAKALFDDFYNKKLGLIVDPEEQIRYYNYFEKVIASIVFAYTALEAMANILIPNEYTVEKKESSGVRKIWDKVAIERTYSLREKFKDILSKTLNTSNPTKEKWWSKFIELEEIRNEIIHSKESKSEERYSKLLDSKIFTIIDTHNETIRFYGKFVTINKDQHLVNQFPYGYLADRVMPCYVDETEFDEMMEEIGNHKFH